MSGQPALTGLPAGFVVALERADLLQGGHEAQHGTALVAGEIFEEDKIAAASAVNGLHAEVTIVY
nr:hypothetical protein [Cupriavidus sp. USMAA2-4]